MTGDAGPGELASPARRPGRVAAIVLAALLLLGGAAALTVGLLGQDADPPDPAAATAPVTVSPAPAPGNTQPTADPAPEPAAAPVPLPVAVSIPAIRVQSDLITLGLNPDGTLAVPQPGPDYDKAAWFDGSPRPGAVGPAVIEGHVDSAANGPSVFYELGALVPGDRVDVTREDGSVVTFAVDDVRVVPKADFPTLDVYGNTERPELRLITCGGPFDRSAGSYVDNVVVFAHQIT